MRIKAKRWGVRGMGDEKKKLMEEGGWKLKELEDIRIKNKSN